MKKAIKKSGKIVRAYRLGEDSAVLKELMEKGKIRRTGDDTYEIFSREAVDGKGKTAHTGDYIRIDSAGYPYPVLEGYFWENHRQIQGEEYEQIPHPVYIWTAEDEECEEIQYLRKCRELALNEACPERFFTAELRGRLSSAAKDAVIVFDGIYKDRKGQIVDVDFNFVARTEFEKTYMLL